MTINKKVKSYALEILETTSDLEKEIATNYWALKDGKLQNKPTDIAKKYNLNPNKLRHLIRGCSHIVRTLDNCIDCDKVRTDTVRSQTAFNSPIKERCYDCNSRYITEYKRDPFSEWKSKFTTTAGNDFMYQEISNPILKTLTDIELEVLHLIIINQTKSKIYSSVFKGDPFNKSIWTIVNKLDRLNLINIKRNANGGIISFDFDPILIHELDNYKNLNKQSNKNSFLITKSNRFEEIKSHDIGTFPLNDGLNLIPGEVYLYGGSTVENGSIYLKFTPVDKMDKAPSQTTIEHEPKPISDIINSMFNRL